MGSAFMWTVLYFELCFRFARAATINYAKRQKNAPNTKKPKNNYSTTMGAVTLCASPRPCCCNERRITKLIARKEKATLKMIAA